MKAMLKVGLTPANRTTKMSRAEVLAAFMGRQAKG
jgi:hypothetical protein